MKRKVFLSALALFVCVSLGFIVGVNVFSENSEYKQVSAMMESDASVQEKVIYLESRVNKEMGSLNILVKHSDLCSNKYLNELDTLRISMKSTIEGYELIKDKINNSKKLTEKYEDYILLYEEYNKLVDDIYDEKYDEALISLKEVNEKREKEYFGIENEISKLGNN